MPLYHVKAAHEDGSLVEEAIEGVSKEAVINTLRSQGLFPISVNTEKHSAFSFDMALSFSSKRHVNRKQRLTFTQGISTLLGAGLTLEQTLKNLQKNQATQAEKNLIKSILEDVLEGKSLSNALNKHPDTFNAFYVAIVKSGEAKGNLGDAFKRLAEHLDKANTLRSTIISAVTYPSILFVLSITSLLFLLLFVIPRFVTMFDGSEQALPTITKVVFWLSGMLISYGWLLLLLLLVGGVSLKLLFKQPEFSKRFYQKLTTLPMIGSIYAANQCAQLTRTLSTLLHSGITLVDALNLAKSGVGSRLLRNHIEQVIDHLKTGYKLADSLSFQNSLPDTAIDLIAIGEESGKLDEMLEKTAVIYEKETSEKLKRLLTFLEPVLILGLGVLIALIILSILLAMLSLNTVITT